MTLGTCYNTNHLVNSEGTLESEIIWITNLSVHPPEKRERYVQRNRYGTKYLAKKQMRDASVYQTKKEWTNTYGSSPSLLEWSTHLKFVSVFFLPYILSSLHHRRKHYELMRHIKEQCDLSQSTMTLGPVRIPNTYQNWRGLYNMKGKLECPLSWQKKNKCSTEQIWTQIITCLRPPCHRAFPRSSFIPPLKQRLTKLSNNLPNLYQNYC